MYFTSSYEGRSPGIELIHEIHHIILLSIKKGSILSDKRHHEGIEILVLFLQQNMVVKVTTNGQKSRSKALVTAVGLSGVESASLKGDDYSQIEVTGDGVDPVLLTRRLRKRVGHAELVSVSAAGGEKKEEKAVEEPPATPQYVWQPYVPPPYVCTPYNQLYEVHDMPPNDPCCCIM
ncbi:heavy metal-associated isoprenylated plant protein 16-like [Durio zibethinus]|uniref:Heavy metal-associated isoprenylated plant protein 16-like n=1 Tax=Durio zibethinus TaxID=66656 RepID=A0A6P5XHQ1_DURZI|nr:heavy metal-associated isoprenylated plant protein 16-like [Durio zibethinus]